MRASPSAVSEIVQEIDYRDPIHEANLQQFLS